MTGHGCSARCGYCGFCSTAADRHDCHDDEPVFCHRCEALLGPLDYKLTMSGATFCSTACLDAHEADEQERRRTRQTKDAS